jgi:hypothetical protein
VLSCRTKLEKLLCLKCRGSRSLLNSGGFHTMKLRGWVAHAGRQQRWHTRMQRGLLCMHTRCPLLPRPPATAGCLTCARPGPMRPPRLCCCRPPGHTCSDSSTAHHRGVHHSSADTRDAPACSVERNQRTRAQDCTSCCLHRRTGHTHVLVRKGGGWLLLPSEPPVPFEPRPVMQALRRGRVRMQRVVHEPDCCVTNPPCHRPPCCGLCYDLRPWL